MGDSGDGGANDGVGMEALRAVQDDVKQLMGPDGAVPSINGVGLDPSGPGNPAAPVEVMLSEPLGYRALRDGLVVRRPRQAPRVGTMTRSTAHGRRPLALTGGAACILVGIAGCSADDRSATPSATAVTTTTTDPTIAVTATAPTRRPLPARPSAGAFASALAESFEGDVARWPDIDELLEVSETMFVGRLGANSVRVPQQSDGRQPGSSAASAPAEKPRLRCRQLAHWKGGLGCQTAAAIPFCHDRSARSAPILMTKQGRRA